MRSVKPNTFIIGAPKCGTSSLAQYLSEHENVFFCNPKEPLYWCMDQKGAPHEPKYANLDEYLDIFSQANTEKHRIVAEGSTRYLVSHVAIKKILKFNPSAKFIVMVRTPVEVVPAYHMEQVYSMYETEENFEKAWNNQKSNRIIDTNGLFKSYFDIAAFGSQVQRAKKLIPDGNLLVIFMEDLKTTPQIVYRKTLDFLGLEDDGRKDFPVVNAAHSHKFQWLAKFVLSPPKLMEAPMRGLRQYLRLRKIAPIEWLKAILNRKQKRTDLSRHIEKEIEDHYLEEIVLLENLTNRNLTSWKTGRKKLNE